MKRISCTTYRVGPALATVAVACLLTAGIAAAQNQPPQPAAATAEVGASDAAPQTLFSNKNLFQIIRDGGILMLPLFACSFLMLVFVFERAISLRRARVIPGPLVKKFLHQLREGKIDRDESLTMCQESDSAVGSVFAAAVRKWGRPGVEMEQAIIDAGERAAMGLRRYIRLFNAIATISPLLGLLGTTLGVIRLLSDTATSDAAGRASALSAGLSEALLTTAGGLAVAIPALCFYVYFTSRVDRLVVEIDSLGQDVVNLISGEALQEQGRSTRLSRRGTAA